MKKLFYIGLFIILNSCIKHKADYAPTIYNFKVIDEFTNEPINGCYLILNKFFSPSYLEKDTIGITDNNGFFKYHFDKEPIHSSDGIVTYRMEFNKENFSYGNFQLEQIHIESNPIIKLNKKTTIGLKMRRIHPPFNCPPESYRLYFNFSTINPCIQCFIEPDTPSYTTYYYHFEKVASKSNVRVGWLTDYHSSCTGIIYSPWSYQNIMTGYDDTTFFNIDY